jgi:hypothetical protein
MAGETVHVGSANGFLLVTVAVFLTIWLVAPLLNKLLSGVQAKYPSIGF